MIHQAFMLRAIALSLLGLGCTAPNPIVGAVVADRSGKIISEGFHVGAEHAEVLALRAVTGSLNECTLYVSLEPCNHYGKTPPCTKAIIESGIKKVVYAIDDPNPVAGGGANALREAGIEVIANIGRPEAAWSNRAWLHKISTGRPYFVWKIASTIDGFTAALDGTSKWITGVEARRDGHILRAQSDAVLIGSGTALADNPSLTPHLINDDRRPMRYIMGLRPMPAESHLLTDGGQTRIITSHNFEDLLADLRLENITQVLVESGSTLGTALMKAGLVDEIVLYQAPALLGSGTHAIGDLGISTLSSSLKWQFSSMERVGLDIKVLLTRKEDTEGVKCSQD
ncbi:MAG TPA: bifunctional diaminohydroxyphosphoribosylaminopyrimidine deaminase/5-amino-6-(5-phosphoribosylamino)uracil reductase RibD [archaeon]|nr:bifunctional diaminohydroxyphosphoribosylaminopyrimidine deaminase/5-amino-6-(5-phosphoribosylamino)uracil reductase RibD [archaeon]